MNALVVAAAASPGSVDLVSTIAPLYDLVVAADGGGAICVEAGVKPHVLIGDFDSIEAGTQDALKASGTEIVTLPPDKDETDLELALALASVRGASRVTVTAASTGRLDHTLGVLAALAGVPRLEPCLREPDLTAWLLSGDERSTLGLEGRGATVSLIPWAGPAVVSATGVRWPLSDETLLPTAARGVSNVLVADHATVTLNAGILWVLAPCAEDTVRVFER